MKIFLSLACQIRIATTAENKTNAITASFGPYLNQKSFDCALLENKKKSSRTTRKDQSSENKNACQQAAGFDRKKFFC